MKHLLILLVFISSIISAQITELNGKIVDSEGTPLYLANVVLLNSNFGTTTDENGNFILRLEILNRK